MESTQFKAIQRWADIFRDYREISVWVLGGKQTQMVTHANELLRVIKVIRSTNDSLTKSQDDVLSKTSLLIDCHSVGLRLISLSRGRFHINRGKFEVEWTDALTFSDKEAEKWGIAFRYLLESVLYVAQYSRVLR